MRESKNISQLNWQLWLDKDATWENDTLYSPLDNDLSSLTNNPPSGGWDKLFAQKSRSITLPATVEEYFSQGVNDWQYHGISWFYTEIEIDTDFKNKRVVLEFEKTRLRAETYINGMLAGYDLVSETPYDVDISDYLQYGQKNTLAIRICNPGGTRGWNDILSYFWGKQELMASHDFSTVGHIHLSATDKSYINDVFIKNCLPALANNILISCCIYSEVEQQTQLNITIVDDENNCHHSVSKNINLLCGMNTIEQSVTVESAKVWDLETPNLYTCLVHIKNKYSNDQVQQVFGFRVMEVRKNSRGHQQFYFNGKRFRHKSAIDWGFYAHIGAYANEEMAIKSVKAAKEIGHNGINFHRQIGEPLIMEQADKLGLYLYEEPGGIKSGDLSWLASIPRFLFDRNNKTEKVFKIENNPLAKALAEEKLNRMIIRDRNHPSILFYCLSNEDKLYTDYRAHLLKLANRLDDSRMIINSSGSTNTAATIEFLKANSLFNGSIYKTEDKKIVAINKQYNFHPYSTVANEQHVDAHSVASRSRFQEDILKSHASSENQPTRYWGEVSCYTGPSNFYAISESRSSLKHNQDGYDNNIYSPLHNKLKENYQHWQLEGTCDGAIKCPEDISIQAGRGLMYINGRFNQAICSHDGNDGYAINGWSSGPQVGSKIKNLTQRIAMDWDSTILDEGRNLKGPAEDYAYWTRPLQIALFRNNGKYFKVGETAQFRVSFINEGKLNKGEYFLNYTLIDGKGSQYELSQNIQVKVIAGDTFSQELEPLEVTLLPDYFSGHITLRAELFDINNTLVCDGQEQVLFSNPCSFRKHIKDRKIAISNWPAAEKALHSIESHFEVQTTVENATLILAAETNETHEMLQILQRVKLGSTLIVQFSPQWADFLYQENVLAMPVTDWGSKQEGFWYGNGWGYISQYIGRQTLLSQGAIGTNGWEANGDPKGFYPLRCNYPCQVHGLWLARHDTLRVLLAEIQYGKGKIIINSAYKLDKGDPLAKHIFYQMLLESE